MSAPTVRLNIALRHRLPHLPDDLSALNQLHTPTLEALVTQLASRNVLAISASSSAAAIEHIGRALKRARADAVARSMIISCHGAGLMICLREVLQLLQSALPMTGIPWLAMRSDRDAHIAQLLDLVAHHKLQLILLGIDALEPQDAHYLASTCARYLSDGALLLVALNERPAPWFADDDVLITMSGGEPQADAREADERAALISLATPLLAAARLPRMAYALAPVAQAIDAAVRLGWMREVNAEWMRTQGAPAPDEDMTWALVERLTQDAARGSAEAALVALLVGESLMSAQQRAEQLERWLYVWLGRGLGPTLWRLIERLADEDKPLEAIRLEVAVATLSPQQLAALPPPNIEPELADAQLACAWSRVLLWRDAAQAAYSWSSRHQRDPRYGQLARVLSVHALMGQRRFEQAFEALTEPIEGLDEQERRWRQITAALCLVWRQEHERARAMLEPWRELPTPARGWLDAAASLNLARGLHLLGALELASALLVQLKLPPDELTLPEYQHDALLHLRALLATERLDLDEALATLAILGPMRESMTAHGIHLQGLWTYLSTLRGDAEAAELALATLHKMAMTLQDWDHLHLWRIYETRWRQYLLGASAPIADAEGAPPASALIASRLELLIIERSWRVEADHQALEAPPDHAPLSIRSWAKARQGFTLEAKEVIVQAQLELQAKRGHRVYTQHLNLAQVAMALGLYALARSSLAQARALLPSTHHRFALAAELELVLGWSQRQVSPQALLGFGHQRGFAARIARGLLGERRGDLLEAQVVGQMAETLMWYAAPLAQGQRPQWCLEANTGRCIGEGLEVRLGGKALAMVVALCEAPDQTLTKESLIAQVWGISDYHPLKHDNRLRMTTFKLRQALPQHLEIEALEDGYILRSGVALIKRRNQEKSAPP